MGRVGGLFGVQRGRCGGYSRDVHYTTVDVRYSYRFANYPHWNLRYAPEATLLARLHETMTTEVNATAPNSRYAAGISPVGFQLVYFPRERVQPFLQTAAGFVDYNDRVLSPQGSQFMFVIDFGTGVNVFLSPRYAMQFGYRYLHTSNANISLHNPGTDADVFYIGFSHFHSKGVR